MVNNDKFRLSLLNMSQAMLNKIHLVGGTSASKENHAHITQFFEAWLFLAADVTDQLDIPREAQLARLKNFCLGLERGDLIDVLNIMMDAADLLISDTVTNYTTFKECITSQHSDQELIVRLLSPISPLLVSLFECPDVKADCLRWILPFLRFGKKLSLKGLDLEEQAITAYLECETRLDAIALDAIPNLVSGMNRIMRGWLEKFNLNSLVPKHGNGSVAEGKLTLYEKYNALQVDLYLKIVLGPYWREYYPSEPGRDLVRVSRTVFVPKTYSKLRTISMEPVTLQYFQQGIMHLLYRYIARHPYLSRRIKLEDQTQNKDMAREGSITNQLATIDLSAASDSVSWKLVKAVFARTPLLKWLYATRSKETKLPTGRVLRLNKFAPMGSALCFPIECLIFACVIEYVSQEWCKRTGLVRSKYSVYGDDLIVDTCIAQEVIEALESLGFQVNGSKSYLTGRFRESCGGDYYDGIDVTSIHYSIDKYNVRSLSPEVYGALCSFANYAEDRGFHMLRGYLIRLVLPCSPYFTDSKGKSPLLYSPNPTNFHCRKKWNEDYQLWLGKFMTVLSTPVHREQEDDDIAYFAKLCQMALSPSVRRYDEPVHSINLHGSRIQLRYVEREVTPFNQMDERKLD